MGVNKPFKMDIPPEKEWQQQWTKTEAEDILGIAHAIRSECPMDERSLWRSAENEFATSKHITRI